MRIVVFFSGTGTNLESIINHQKKYGYEVCSCFTNNPRAGGIDICKDHALDCKVIDNNSFFKNRTIFKPIYLRPKVSIHVYF